MYSMLHSVVNILAYVCYATLLVACSHDVTQEQHQTDEVSQQLILQLQEINSELKSVKLELAQVKNAVTEMHRKTVGSALANGTPPPSVKQVTLDDDPMLGDTEAKYAIVEFSDYECPFCKRYSSSVFKKIKEKYIDTGKVKYVFKDFPLAFHKNAKTAAVAANCAGKQNQYWAMHTELFENQRELGKKAFSRFAENIGLDVNKFEICQTDVAQIKEVEADFSYGSEVGVRGTPHFFIGKVSGGKIVDVVQISGARPFSDFSSKLEKMFDS